MAVCQASLSSTISWSLLKLMSIELVMLSNHLILCHPLLLLHSIFPIIRVFSSELALHIRWPKYWTFSISPSNEYSGLMSFRIDQFDLLAVQGILKNFSAPQFKSINSSALSLFYLVILYTVSNISKPCQLEHSKTKLITAFFFLSSDLSGFPSGTRDINGRRQPLASQIVDQMCLTSCRKGLEKVCPCA